MRVLVAYDEPGMIRLLNDALTDNNYVVDIAKNGDEAYGMVRMHNYDCIIIDGDIPGKDAREMVGELRRNSNMTPVLLISDLDSINERNTTLDFGVDDFITRPFQLKELLTRVYGLCNRSSDNSPDTLQFADLTLNYGTYEISVNNNFLRLTHKEFQVLELLMKSPQTVFSTEALMAKFWDWDKDVEINVVWTNIGYIRRKLESLKSNAEIKSFRGRGYQLVAK